MSTMHNTREMATWNGFTNYQTPQEFMNESRAKGLTTPEEAVAAYVVEYSEGMAADPDWSNTDWAEVESDLVSYLTGTHGEEWQ